MEQRLLNQRQAATFIGVSWQQLNRIVERGEIPTPLKQTAGRSARKFYKREWLEDYIARLERQANRKQTAEAKAQALLES